MPNYTVTNNIDTLLRSTTNAAARTNLGLGDAATKNTGTTAGTVAAGDDSRITGAVQTSGGTMTGKLTAAASDTEAKLNVGSRLTTGAPSTIAAGDIWVSNQGALTYRDSSGPTSRALAATTLPNTFNQPQTIGSTANAGAVLSVSNSGTREVVTISNTATATSDAVVITNLGSGNSLVVNDETTPDSTRFAVANNGRVGIGVAPDASVALAVDSTGIKFGDGTTQTTAASGGSGTVTSITAGTGLTGGTITTSGTVAADFGTTTGKVTEGGTTVLKAGDTMTGKLNLGNVASTAPVNLGANVNPTPVANGDVWLNASNQLTWRGNNGATYPAASTVAINSFTAAQGISASTAGAVLGVTQTTGAGTAISVTQNATGTGSGITVDLNNTSSTATAVRITNQGTGASLVVEDQASVDPTPFTVSASGRVGVGVAPDAAVALSVDTTGIKFGDGTIQTTAGGAGGVSSFSAGTTGLTPATSTTGAVTLAGTLAIANGGTGQTTQQAALNALAGAVTSGQYLRGTGANVTLSAIQAADVPTLNQNTTGTASNVTGTVAIANGGTGQTTAANAINALVPAQSGQSGKVLTTNGSVVSWGTAGAGGITALTGDVSASGSGSVSSTIIALRGRSVASTAPTTGQVLGWNGSQWEPTSAGGSVSYDILKILFTGPTSGTYNVPSGYKYADIYAAGGGGGGGAGAYINGPFAVSGGGGGACGVFGRREKVYVENAFITYDIGAGGAGGYMDVNGNATNGLAGQGTLVLLQAGGPQFPILDCGFYINQQTATGGQGGSTSSSGGGSLSFFDIWVQDAQTGGGGLAGGPGQPPTNNTAYSSNVYVSAGAGGGGVDASLTLYDGGNINDRNYILYSSGSAIQYKGTAGSSTSIDATSPMSISPIHFGGAGGAAANTSTAIYNGTFYRAGNGANGQPGCGGGGGGCMYDDLGAGPGSYAGGNGGNGGAGFLLMYLYK
jgi:hypothetical protein